MIHSKFIEKHTVKCIKGYRVIYQSITYSDRYTVPSERNTQ